MKIYTRTGDKGDTALFGGGRVEKSHSLIKAYGTVDELNALVGMARSRIDTSHPSNDLLRRLQNELFELGADLATPLDAKPVVPRIKQSHIDRLESSIDKMDEELAPLKRFILPGGTGSAAALHLARTVCRRAGRLTVAARHDAEINHFALVYLNRLSDLLFTTARYVNFRAGAPDEVWST